MGLTYVWVKVANPAKPKKTAKLRTLVDSGAGYSLVPAPVLAKLGIRPHRERSFLLADGSEVKRQMGDATFHFHDEMASSPVIFGARGDAALLGVVSLDALGLSPM